MTLTDLLQKIRSTEKRDALAREVGICFNEWKLFKRDSKFNVFYKDQEIHNQGYLNLLNAINFANVEFEKARTKDVELLVALLEKAIWRRNGHIRSCYTDMAIKKYIEEADKELAELAEKFTKENKI